MTKKSRMILAVLITATLLAAAPPPRAEYSADINDEIYYILLLAIIEDPDPIPVDLDCWGAVGTASGGDLLNFGGDARGDGCPDTAINPQSGAPLATWAYRSSTDHDIAISEWAVDHWGETRFLTSDTADQRDPSALIEPDGRAHVVWWTAGGAEKLFHATREPGSDEWGLPEPIADAGRRPSLVGVAEGLLVAYERDAPSGGQQVVVAKLLHDGPTTFEVVAQTERTEPLDVMIHFSAGRLWVDWKHGDGQFAYAVESGGSWGGPVTLPWDDKSWVGEEELRKIVRAEVFAN